MSVVVRMEMPEGCGDCRIAQFGYCGITHEPVADAYVGYQENRPKTCPILVTIPLNASYAYHMGYAQGYADGRSAAPRWIMCEDELPDLLQFVVVCNDEGKCVVAQYVGYQTDSMTPWRIAYSMYDTDAYNEADEGPACYWMPLPEPPKEDA